ncbi:hypothetical protein POVWA2_007370 [Plasmodium ovale wallikeri]|uniref:Uncharacterized protein n=1 Tax=Plasmodium ovale wallikeri TaxID=864142 RepID=A0A1A8YIU8_PLAOA|nr:hypothetical protein POVWA1_007230 [Plasmodium ovale wallikeri]SBT32035.1 hypothetical protein POVWA2_007370 [Plasmodium ovale wallikeri]
MSLHVRMCKYAFYLGRGQKISQNERTGFHGGLAFLSYNSRITLALRGENEETNEGRDGSANVRQRRKCKCKAN